MDELLSTAERLAHMMRQRQIQLVLAESCTAGSVAAALGSVPGISEHLCGSLVTYQSQSKIAWLRIDPALLERFSAESIETSQAMADAALRLTPQATLAAAITGHLGPDAPTDKDGCCYLALASRMPLREPTSWSGRLQLCCSGRVARQKEAATGLLEKLADWIQ